MTPLFDMTKKYTGDPVTRHTDPATSQDAAKSAPRGDCMVPVVRAVMADGIPRIDAEIHADGLAAGQRYSPQSYRRGRKALADLGEIKPTGRRRQGNYGGLCREWVRADVKIKTKPGEWT